MYFEKLRENLSATVTYPRDLLSLLENAQHVWQDFCELPTDIKQRFVFSDSGNRDPGYQERSKAKGREDKWYFHYVPDMAELIREQGLEPLVEEHAAINRFLKFAAAIEPLVYKLVLTIGRDLEPHVPGIYSQLDRGRNHCVYRFLYYTARESETVLAAPHFDRCGFTLQLMESRAGLELLNWDHQWVPTKVYPEHALLFPSYKLEAATGGVLQKTWHRVVRSEKVASSIARKSLLLFVPLIDVPGYQEEARSQDLVPGYQPRK
jgi:isopenicillin N synthase-like dioxygenase